MTKSSKKDQSSRAHSTKVIIPLCTPIAGEDENSGFLKVESKPKGKTSRSKKEKIKRMSDERTDIESNDDHEIIGGDTTKNSDDDILSKELRIVRVARYGDGEEYKKEEKTRKCLSPRMKDLCKILTLWAIITGMALSISVVDRNNRQSSSPITNSESPSCSLCPAGTSVTNPDLEIITIEFQCTAISSSLESTCFFECLDDGLPTHRVYTCAEVEQLAKDSTSKCSDSADSCREFQQASDQCCYSE